MAKIFDLYASAGTPAKRYSAMNIGCPWRGLNVVPSTPISQGERQAVMYLYSDPLVGPATAKTFALYGTP